MVWDHEREIEKKQEIIEEVASSLKGIGVQADDINNIATKLVDNLISTTPPEKEEVCFELITASSFSGRGGGKSVKAGNIRLNIGKLLEAASSGVFTAISVSAAPWAVPFAALLLWRSLWSSAEIPISETEVVVLIALHRLKNAKKIVEKSEIEILDSVNQALRKHERQTISQSDLRHAMKILEKIDSIEKVKTSGGWFIREWVRVSYR